LSLFYPERAAIEAYGDGGFRFAHLSHRGSLLILPSGTYAWDTHDCSTLTMDDFTGAFAEASRMDFLLLGTGARMQRPPNPCLQAFEGKKLGLDFMDTGAAIRTYNMLLAEKRAFGCALIAVGTAP
jgi:uncharacterized protein